MEYKNLTKDVKIPALGIGTWKMGGVVFADKSKDDLYLKAIDYAIRRGLTHIDCAELYGRGHAEELVGQVIKKYNRKKLFITTKVLPHHLFSERQIRKHLEKSLERLGTSFLDLYLIHWPNPAVSLEKTIATLDKMVNEKLTRFIGVSNFGLDLFQKAQSFAKNQLVTNQVEYNLLDHSPEENGLLNYCQRHKIILTAYSPLAQGKMMSDLRHKLQEIGEKYQKTIIQIALRWLLDKPYVITIPKASTPEHIDEVLGALGWHLKRQDTEWLDTYNG